MTLALLLLLKAAVSIIIFAVGLDFTPADATWLLRRPDRLLRSLLAMYVLVPLAAVVLVKSVSRWPRAWRSACWCSRCRPARRSCRAS